MLHEMGYETGIDLERLVACAREVQRRAGPPAGEPRADGGAGGLAPGLSSRHRGAGRDRARLGDARRAALGRVDRGPAARAGRGRRAARAVPLPAHLRVRAGRSTSPPGRSPRSGRRRLVAAATLASFELEYSGRSQWLRRLLPRAAGCERRRPPARRGAVERTLVLVAHHDAARTGLMWDPRLSRAGDRAAQRSGKRASLALLPEVGAGGGRLGLRRAAGRRARARAGAGARPGAQPGRARRQRQRLRRGRRARAGRAARASPAAGAGGHRAVPRLRGVGHGRDGRVARVAGARPGADARARPRHDRLGRAGRPRGRGRRLAGALRRRARSGWASAPGCAAGAWARGPIPCWRR